MGANEKHQAAYHGTTYTPSTDQVRNAYGAHIADCNHVTKDSFNEFDRWLAGVKAEAKAEALEEAADAMDADASVHDPLRLKSDWIRIRATQLRKETRVE